MSLASSIPVLGLESVCSRKGCPWPWPRIFLVSLALASSLVSSTPPLLNANFDKLNELLTNYDILLDIIAISETKLKLLQVYNAKLSEYHFYHKGTTTRWGGVGLFIKESLSISICKEFDLNIPNCEDMWIQLNLGNNKKCIVGVIYRHPKQKLSESCKSFESTIEKLNSRKLMYYIGGDFKANLLNSNSDINIKGSESSSQFRWFTIAKIEL